MKRGILRWLALGLAILGLVISEYLLSRRFTLAADLAAAGDWCSALFGRGCDATLKEDALVLLGVPLAGWGIVFFGSFLGLLVLGGLIRAFGAAAAAAAFLLSLAGAATSVVLALRMAFGSPFCPLCTTLHVVSWVQVPTTWALGGRSVLALLPRRGREPVPDAAWKAVALFSVAMIAVSLYLWVLARDRLQMLAGPIDPQQVWASHDAAARHEIEIEKNDPRLGPPGARARLVLFSDFQCPGCSSFSRRIRGLIERYGGQVSIVFLHFPLAASCNPRVGREFHPRSCQAAWAGEAARRQGRFWEFHDALFDFGARATEEQVLQAAKTVGLDPDRFAADRASAEVRAKVKGDIERGHRARVDGTPALYLDGRRVRDLRRNALDLLLRRALGPR